jgi:hypothetical protein
MKWFAIPWPCASKRRTAPERCDDLSTQMQCAPALISAAVTLFEVSYWTHPNVTVNASAFAG